MIEVTVTAQDIEDGIEECVTRGNRAEACALARALRRVEPEGRVLVYSWHRHLKKGPARPGIALPPAAFAFVKAFDARVVDEIGARATEALGGKADRRVPAPKPATFSLPVPA